ncbi:ferredoxin [Tilletiopsis washingtonensis]|uniref:Ferredoxin n=1 Tax=Tilletiopsis washingtonensis TaxID=58919 RepID=A0A316ZBU3_9BASI|nr:ferredoxin [Tilletiopsis washingtonensis]PWN97745.1 ferredoxin [Tilletiopsis washingtonensis]
MLRPLFRLRPLARSSLAALAPRPLAPLRLAPVARALHVSAVRAHGSITRPPKGEGIRLIFRDAKGEEKEVRCNEGDDILGVAHEWDIELEGACEGSIACSTCHVILPPEHYDALEEPGDDENDMLDLAFGLTDTSRLGCQVHVDKSHDGMVVQLPAATRNMRVDGSKPTHH